MGKIPNLKILFITSEEPNQGDIYFKGLKAILHQRCIEWPYKALYHLSVKNGKIIGYDLHGQMEIEEDNFGFLINRRYMWKAPRYFGYISNNEYDYHQLPDLNDFDAIIFNFLRSEYQKKLMRKVLCNNSIRTPIFFIDGEDDPFLRLLYFSSKVKGYFKREILSSPSINKHYLKMWSKVYIYQLRKNKLNLNSFSFPAIRGLPKLLPLNLTVATDMLNKVNDDKNKSIDISFIASMTSSYRLELYKFLVKYVKKRKLKADIRIVGKFGKDWIPHNEYQTIVSNSKLSISAQGTGFDTYRYWEIPFYGSTLVSQKPFIFIENNFVDGESAIFFSNFKELERKLDYYLLKDLWEDVCRKGREHFLKYHTHIHRAIKILETIEMLI
ncbi:MAG: glycosyltransferase [archaeon YNP-LCB-003-016]|uniref:glycosyltransferase family protein n=1 Tax=Candidatus Culexarchaeum yellowstonense TaxID=2928963 RepID=UPI0026F1732C|nr:glycosyltransferase [Candidatus Culexarchaeum yellowstonense]MCR6692205.1 glycosyltransferase [Candidatus Culexarchaeum yellowstonense]